MSKAKKMFHEVTGELVIFETPNPKGEPAFRWTVKKDFLNKFDIIPHINSTKVYEHMNNYKIEEYLHNPNGPAVDCLRIEDDPKSIIPVGQKVPFEQWYIDGKLLNVEEVEKLKHNLNFSDKFKKFIDG